MVGPFIDKKIHVSSYFSFIHSWFYGRQVYKAALRAAKNIFGTIVSLQDDLV